MRPLHVVVPAGVDDPGRPSGGNVYDRRLATGLERLGWHVRVHPLDRPLAQVLAALPDRSAVLVDGLVAVPAADDVVAGAERLGVAVLLHLPFAESDPQLAADERRVLRAAGLVVAVSTWTRDWVVAHHGLDPGRVVVAEPGTDRGPLVTGTAGGRHLLCVGAVTPVKGHDLLVAALARLGDLDWTCTCVGALDVAPRFVADLHAAAREAGIADRIDLRGPLVGHPLDEARAAADVAVSASRHESYGMALAEALGRGLPVVATDVGGVREAVGCAPDGTVPGLLVPPQDPDALARVLRRWLDDAGLRARLRGAAAARRDDLTSWQETAGRVAAALDVALNRTGPGPVVTTDHPA